MNGLEQDVNELLTKFRVHDRHLNFFVNNKYYNKQEGLICKCGHPADVHKGLRCTLAACGCDSVGAVVTTSDIRPFFQATHGPMEAHALGRGLTLCDSLSIAYTTNLICANYCKNYTIIGACRHASSGKTLQPKQRPTERHVIYCNWCLEDLCLERLY